MATKNISINNKTFTVSYLILNPTKKQDIVILHGWGSNKRLMKQSFARQFEQFRHIYIDLPGFGQSSNNYTLCTQDYAEIVQIFLDEIQSDKYIVMGHSFGGKVGVLLRPVNLILLSSAGILVTKSLKVRIKIRLFKLLKLFGLSRFYRVFASKDANNLSHNMYQTFKNVVDEDFSNIFASFQGKAYIFWGRDDTATPLSSGKKISKLIKNSEFYPLDGDHFFFMKTQNQIDNKIKGL